MFAAAALLVLVRLASAQTPSLLDTPTTQVAAGGAHTCALTTAGAVLCWGGNNHGQLGNGTTTDAHTPVPVTGLASGVAAITAGRLHACALTTAGAVLCWGANGYGGLGNGTTTDASTPVAVTGLASGVVAITAGRAQTCALTTAGAVLCWGGNTNGQVGNGTTTDAHTPIQVNGLASGAVAIAAGGFHTCALTTAGAVQCWGDNSNGQLGNGTTTDAHTPVPMSGLVSGATAITAGDTHTCALTATGGVQCWGVNGNGELGNGASVDSSTPVPVSGLALGITAIAAGEYHTCALTTAGTIRCWGFNSDGELDNGAMTDALTPVAVTGLASGVTAITAGGFHTCALSTTGGVQCWGRNDVGQLGNGATTGPSAPVAVSGLATGVAAIAAGGLHTCALTTAGAAQCWGANGNGQLGNGSTTDAHTPIPVTGLTSGTETIAAGTAHTCASTTTGGVQCWGANGSGQLGNGTTTDASAPVAVTSLTSGVASIAAGAYHTCALTTAAAVQCWGYNNYGQLGNGTTTGSSSPIPVTGLASDIAAIAAGGYHTCALTTAGAVQCWGDNSNGQLGDGTTTDSHTPVSVTGLASGVAAIAAGTTHTCALTTSGAVLCWGANGNGQVGDGTTTDAHTPIPVTGLASGVTAIAAGAYHTCALTTAGAVQCWGSNHYGQVGNGATLDATAPVAVTNLASGAAAVAAGEYHTCALTTAGGMQCWGDNGNGQLGNGTTADAHSPVAILTGQSLSFAPGTPGQPLNTIAAAGRFTLSASATGPGNAPITFDTWTPNTCSVIGNQLSITGAAGSLCGVRASRAGGSDGSNGTTTVAPQQPRLLLITAAATPAVPAPMLSHAELALLGALVCGAAWACARRRTTKAVGATTCPAND